MKIQPKSIRRFAAALLLCASGAQSAFAGFVTANSSFGNDTLVLDTQTGIEWLKLDATLGLSYDFVASQLDAGEMFSGFSVASILDVTTLFQDAGVWAPLAPLTSASALASGAAFAGYFGGYNSGSGISLEGMTNASLAPYNFQQRSVGVVYRAGISTSSWDDAYHSRSGPGSASVGTWLTRSVTPVPEPTTYVLMLTGLAAVGWATRRRRGPAP
jgi:hypothetical protein